MPLPSLTGIPRMGCELSRYELKDALLDEPVVVWLRPLLDIEKDALEESIQKFVARFVTGGFQHPTTNEWKDKPEPIIDDRGVPIPMSVGFARQLHRYEAMQKPMVARAKPESQEVATVLYMAEMAIKLKDAWRDLQAAAAIEWQKGESGEAWGHPVSSAKPPSGS